MTVRRGSIVWIVLVGIAVGIAVTLVAILIPWLPTSASKEREGIDFTFWFVTAICISIFALVASVMLYSIVKFRARPDDDSDGAPIHGHTGLEIAWTAVPAVLVTAISIVSAIVLYRNDDADKSDMTVMVTGQQFAWSFKYPGQGNLASTDLVLPLGRQVTLELESLDVIHSFNVPEFGGKSDAVPQLNTHVVVTPSRLGRWAIQCTELCGLGHAAMRAQVRVVRPAQFAAWVREQREAAAGDGGNAAQTIFEGQGCGSCHVFTPAGSTGQIGPNLDRVEASAQRAGEPVDDYVRESIVRPDAYIAPGFRAGVMPAFEQLSDEQLDALVQYLTRGGEGA